MLDDDQIKACLSFKKDICIGSGWKIVCDDEMIRKYINLNLREKLETTELGKSFDDILRDMLSSFEYGFSLSEPVYKINEDGLYEVKSIRVRPPHSFKFDIDRFGSIIQILQNTDKGEISIEPTKLLHHVYQQEYGNPYGKSDMKAAHTPWASKKFFLRFFAMYVEKFACPPVIGRYNPNMDQNEVTKYYNTLKSLQNSSTFVIPEDTTLEFPQPSRDSTDSYIKGLDMFNMWISRSVLVPDLLGISGSKVSGGSFSLGQTQYKLFLNTIEKERQSLQRKITIRLIRPMVNINFGDVPCSFEFNPITQEDELEYSRLWSDFMKSRIVSPSEEEINHFRKSVKYPEGPIELISPNVPGFPEEDEKTSGIQAGDKEQEKKMELKLFRQKTKFENKIDFAQMIESIKKHNDGFERKLRPLFNIIVSDLIKQVKEKEIIKQFKPENIQEIRPRYLRDLNQGMFEGMAKIYKSSYEATRKDFFPESEKKFTDSEIYPEEFLRIIESDAFKSVGDYSIEVTKKLKNKVMSAIKNGVSESELTAILKEELGSVSEAWLQTFARTKTTEMFNSARKTYYETDEIAKNVVEAYQWSAIMDDRTSEVCQYLDEKVFPKGPEVDRLGPPAHFNCRSVLIPITKYEDYELDDVPSVDKLQSMGGNLIFSLNKEIKKFEDIRSSISITKNINTFYEVPLIDAPNKQGDKIELRKIDISNADSKHQISVIIGDRITITLPKSGGTFSQNYGIREWILNPNMPLTVKLVGLSSDTPNVDINCLYNLVR